MVSFSSQNPGLFAHREGIQNWRNLDALVFVSLICFETHGKDWEGIYIYIDNQRYIRLCTVLVPLIYYIIIIIIIIIITNQHSKGASAG